VTALDGGIASRDRQARIAEPEEATAAPVELPPLPQPRSRRSRGLLISFLLCVILPTALVGAYYFFVAADQYEAEFRFTVTEAKTNLPGPGSGGLGVGGSSALGPLSSVFGGASAGLSLQNYLVIDYLLSREAVEQLERKLQVRSLYGEARAPDDMWARFDGKRPMENFVEYWNSMTAASYDPVTGLATVRVKAFRAQDAYAIAAEMVTLAEDLINNVARRSQIDAVRFAENEVKRAEDRMKDVRSSLSDFRFREGIIDPNSSVSGNVELIKALRTQLIQLQTEQASLGLQQHSANSPTAQVLLSKVAATKEQLAQIEAEVAKSRQGSRALAEIVARYEQLDLERQYAQTMLISTLQALDQARANAAAQHLYLTPYVRPVLPSSSLHPKRAQGTILMACAFFGIWLVGVMAVRSVREHL